MVLFMVLQIVQQVYSSYQERDQEVHPEDLPEGCEFYTNEKGKKQDQISVRQWFES